MTPPLPLLSDQEIDSSFNDLLLQPHLAQQSITSNCGCDLCRIGFSSSSTFNRCSSYGQMLKLLTELVCGQQNLNNNGTTTMTPPDKKNNLFRKCCDACELKDDLDFQQLVSQEVDLLDMLIKIGQIPQTTSCVLDLYVRYLSGVMRGYGCWTCELWNEFTHHVVSHNATLSKQSIELLEQLIVGMHSKTTATTDVDLLKGSEAELLENVCHIFTMVGHTNKKLIPYLYMFVDFVEDAPVLNQTQTINYITNCRGRLGPMHFDELDRDIRRWSEEGISNDESEHRLRRLLFFKLHLDYPAADNELFKTLYCEYIVGDSPIKHLLLTYFQLYYKRNSIDFDMLIHKLIEKNQFSQLNFKSWTLVAQNIKLFNMTAKEKHINDILRNVKQCINLYNTNNNDSTFTLVIFEIIDFMDIFNQVLINRQVQLLLSCFNAFCSHLEDPNSCTSLSDDDCNKFIHYALHSNENKHVKEHKRLAIHFATALQREILKPDRTKVVHSFETVWLMNLESFEKASIFCNLFENNKFWDDILKSPLNQLSHTRLQLLNKLFLAPDLVNLFLPNTSAMDHIQYVSALTSHPYVAVFQKGKPLAQDFFTFSFIVNRILENLETNLINNHTTAGIDLNSISVYFSKIALYYARNASDLEFQSFKCMVNVIVLTTNENNYDDTVLEASKLFMTMKLNIHSSRPGVALFAVFKLLKMMKYIMDIDEAASYDFTEPLQFYLNVPIIRANPQLFQQVFDTQQLHNQYKADQEQYNSFSSSDGSNGSTTGPTFKDGQP